MASSRLLLVFVVLVILSGCNATSGSGDNPAQAAVSAPSAAEPAAHLPTGWRWESYDHLQIAVPGDWEYGTTDRPGASDQSTRIRSSADRERSATSGADREMPVRIQVRRSRPAECSSGSTIPCRRAAQPVARLPEIQFPSGRVTEKR